MHHQVVGVIQSSVADISHCGATVVVQGVAAQTGAERELEIRGGEDNK